MASDCVYRSISLQPGETYVLPPGATLVGTDNVGNLTSGCDILNDLEEMTCYVGFLPSIPPAAIQGSQTTYLEAASGNACSFEGYDLNGTRILFNTPYTPSSTGLYDIAAITAETKTLIPGIVAIATNTSILEDHDRGNLVYLVVKTIPSIGENLKIIGHMFTPTSWKSDVEFLVKFMTLDDANTASYQFLPDCP